MVIVPDTLSQRAEQIIPLLISIAVVDELKVINIKLNQAVPVPGPLAQKQRSRFPKPFPVQYPCELVRIYTLFQLPAVALIGNGKCSHRQKKCHHIDSDGLEQLIVGAFLSQHHHPVCFQEMFLAQFIQLIRCLFPPPHLDDFHLQLLPYPIQFSQLFLVFLIAVATEIEIPPACLKVVDDSVQLRNQGIVRMTAHLLLNQLLRSTAHNSAVVNNPGITYVLYQ